MSREQKSNKADKNKQLKPPKRRKRINNLKRRHVRLQTGCWAKLIRFFNIKVTLFLLTDSNKTLF